MTAAYRPPSRGHTAIAEHRRAAFWHERYEKHRDKLPEGAEVFVNVTSETVEHPGDLPPRRLYEPDFSRGYGTTSDGRLVGHQVIKTHPHPLHRSAPPWKPIVATECPEGCVPAAEFVAWLKWLGVHAELRMPGAEGLLSQVNDPYGAPREHRTRPGNAHQREHVPDVSRAERIRGWVQMIIYGVGIESFHWSSSELVPPDFDEKFAEYSEELARAAVRRFRQVSEDPDASLYDIEDATVTLHTLAEHKFDFKSVPVHTRQLLEKWGGVSLYMPPRPGS